VFVRKQSGECASAHHQIRWRSLFDDRAALENDDSMVGLAFLMTKGALVTTCS
jgi:hypothetical protein